MKTRASWPLCFVLLAVCACDSGGGLSEAADQFCGDEMLRLEGARGALSSGRTETTIGELFSAALAARLETNFLFCVHTRRIAEGEAKEIRLTFSIASDHYFRARNDLGAAGKQMAAMIAAYRVLLAYPVR